ncbi:MAG: NTP transferase domain-containing protein [Devosia sp.]
MHGPFGVVLLAAGLLARYGDKDKLCEPLGDSTVLGQAIDHAKAGGDELVVVCRPDAHAVHSIVAKSGARWVANPSYADGMSTSIACGVSYLAANLAGVFVCLGDMPFLEPDDFSDCKVHFASWRDISHPVFHGEQGHPGAVRQPVSR